MTVTRPVPGTGTPTPAASSALTSAAPPASSADGLAPLAPARSPGRLAWVDVVKGLAIVLVVHYHAVLHLDAFGVVPGWLDWLDYVLAQMRMPLLFLASGLFAAGTTSGSWRRLLHKRVAHFAWLYVVWCLLYALYLDAVPQAFREPALTTWPRLLEWTVAPSGVLWFIYGLALFSVLVKLLAPVPLALQVGAAAALSVAVSSGWLAVPGDAWYLMGTAFVFFLLGVRCSGALRALAARATWWWAVGLGGAAFALELVAGAFDLRLVPGVDLLTSVLLVGGAVAACVVVAPSRLGRAAAWLGQRTLSVYLLHMIVLGVIVLPLVLGGVRPLPGVGALEGAAATVVLTALAVAVSLLVYRVLVRLGATWLFALPRRWAWAPSAGATPDAGAVVALAGGGGTADDGAPADDGVRTGEGAPAVRAARHRDGSHRSRPRRGGVRRSAHRA